MAKEIKTKAGTFYSVTMTGAGTVSCMRGNAEYVLVSLGAAGQALFMALTERTLVSDDGATVVAKATGLIAGGADVAMVEQLLDDAIMSETTNIPTPKGTEDSVYQYADIPARYIPAGELHSIVLQGGAQSTNAYESAAYLSIWQEQAPGTDNFQPVAVSTNALRIGANMTHEWFFDKPVLLNERIRFFLSDAGDNPAEFNARHNIRSRVIPTPRWQEGHVFTPYTEHKLPEIVVKMAARSPQFTPAAHSHDVMAHLTLDEHAGLTELLSRKDEILTMFPQAVMIPEL